MCENEGKWGKAEMAENGGFWRKKCRGRNG